MGEQQRIVNAWRFGILSILLILAFLASGIGFCVVNIEKNVASVLHLNAADNNVVRYWGTETGEIDNRKGISSGGFAERRDKVCYISNAGELAYMRYAISSSGRINSTEDYTGYTFELSNNIDLSVDSANCYDYVRDEHGDIIYEDGKAKEELITVYPYWVPIEIGTLGKNKNITFNGNGYKITGLHIKYDDMSTAKNAGFFASMIGGAVTNVTFVDPVIEYSYQGTSIKEDDASRPEHPSEVCVGVVAGAADSTYISNVNIINPTISVTTDNDNAHNFCVGSVIGKLSFTRKNESESINVSWPKQWGLDRVKICKDANDNTKQPSITMQVKQGTDENTTYGKATYGYLGGLVGVNVSSKIINSTFQDALLVPNIAGGVEGTYYVGGIAGLTTQVAPASNLIVAAGLYNNLVLNIDLATIADGATRYCGNLVGRVYAGSWVYNNLVVGVAHGYGNDGKLWKDVTNNKVYYDKESTVVDCIGHTLNGADQYYFTNRGQIGDCISSGDHTHCTTHQEYMTLSENEKIQFDEVYYDFGIGENAGTQMAEYNWGFVSVADYNSSDFVTNKVYYHDGDNIASTYSKNDLMSYIDNFYTKDGEGQRLDDQKGLLFYASLPIIRFEVGLTIDKTNPVTNEELSYEDKLLETVYQFCRWSSGPVLGDLFGEKYTITFKASGYTYEKYPDNYPDESLRGKLMKPTSDAYFSEGENSYVNKNNNEQNILRNYQQYIYETEAKPVCEGYKFLGWKIENYEDVKPSSLSFPDKLKPYVDADGYYIFGSERVTEARTLVAMWELGEFYVSFYQRNPDPDSNHDDELLNPHEEVVEGETFHYSYKVKYDRSITYPADPASVNGFRFEGWYTKVPDDGVVNSDVYKWDTAQRMPGDNLKLYTGWKNNFEKLSELLDNKTYKKYFAYTIGRDINDNEVVEFNPNVEDQDLDSNILWFEDETGADFKQKYHTALTARNQEDKNNYGTLITNLEDSFNHLKIDPLKLKQLDAFDETRTENSCPFLYENESYLSYISQKEKVNKFADTQPYENLTWSDEEDRITKYKGVLVTYFTYYYEQMKEEFEALKFKDNLVKPNGMLLDEVDAMIKKYINLKAEYNSLVNNGEYEKYDMRALEDAKESVEAYWEFNSLSNTPLKEIEAAVAAYEAAWNNKQLKTASTDGNGGSTDNSDSKKKSSVGMSPVVLSVVVVTVLAALTFGYIGVDFVINRRRLTKKRVANVKDNNNNKVTADDDDTYI